jgi:hypothetical protein
VQLFSFQKNACAFGILLAMACGGFIVIAGRPATADDAPAPTSAPTAAATTAPAPAAEANDDDDDKSAPKTPDQKMQSRFPQPIRVGDLIGQPVETAMHETLGYVQHVVRAPDGKIQLIVPYRPWLGWAQFLEGYDTKPVAVPIEVVGSMGPALSSIDWDREAFAAAPKWTDIGATELSANEIIRIAIARE